MTGALKKDLYNKLDLNYTYFTTMKQRLEDQSSSTIAKHWMRFKVNCRQDDRKNNREKLKFQLMTGFKRRMGQYLKHGLDAKLQKKTRKGYFGLRKGLAKVADKPKMGGGGFLKLLAKQP